MLTLVSNNGVDPLAELLAREAAQDAETIDAGSSLAAAYADLLREFDNQLQAVADFLLISVSRSEENTSELQSRSDLVCRLLL